MNHPDAMVKKHHPSSARYIVVWLALVGLTLLSFLLSLAPLGEAEIAAALGIAVAKTLLVLLFFMHLIEERGANAFAFGTAAFFIVLLAALMTADVITREERVPNPPGAVPPAGPLPP